MVFVLEDRPLMASVAAVYNSFYTSEIRMIKIIVYGRIASSLSGMPLSADC